MPNKHLIFVIISVLVITLVYTPSITFAVPNEANSPGTKCDPAGKSDGTGWVPKGRSLVKCCWSGFDDKYKVVTYCSTCEDGGTRGKINCTDPVQSFTLPSNLDDIPILEEADQTTSQPGLKALKGGLDSLLQEDEILEQQPSTSQPSTQGGLLGLLDEEQRTIQPFSDTSVPKEESEGLNLLEENEQESPGTEPGDTDNKNIIKEDSKDDEQDNNNQIYCIRAPCPGSNSNDNQDQLSETPEDEIKSEEDEKEDSNEGEQEQEQ